MDGGTSKILIEAFKRIPEYICTFSELISSPIKYISQQIEDKSAESFSKAFMFLAVYSFIASLGGYLIIGSGLNTHPSPHFSPQVICNRRYEF
jgi:hypothetical protein